MGENRKYQYWLRRIKGVGNKKQKKIVEYCGGAKEAYGLSKRQLMSIPGISERDAEALVQSRSQWDLEQEVEILTKTGIRMTAMEDAEYPKRLKCLSDPPYAIFYKGKLPSPDEKAAAIVGARMCSSYGRAVALELGKKLAECKVSIISGMAYGIDSFGHWGAIHGEGRTYAVLGCGPDVCYPPKGQELYGKIEAAGGIFSEYPPGALPSPGQFPARNRLISAFSDFVIVVEAKKKSGSLITADFAIEQGKDVYAVPGRIGDALSAGCNDLIRQGAGIISDFSGFLQDLGLSEGSLAGGKETEKIKNSLEKQELMVYSCFDLYPRNMEELVKMTKIPAPALADLLVRLQAKGLIEEYYKNHYRKK